FPWSRRRMTHEGSVPAAAPARSLLVFGKNVETLAAPGVAQTPVRTHEGMPAGMVTDGDQGRAQLHRIRRSQGVRGNEPHRAVTSRAERRDLRPGSGEVTQRGACCGVLGAGQLSLTSPAFDRRDDLDGRHAPRDEASPGELPERCGITLLDAQGDQGGCVPVLHGSEAILAVLDQGTPYGRLRAWKATGEEILGQRRDRGPR